MKVFVHMKYKYFYVNNLTNSSLFTDGPWPLPTDELPEPVGTIQRGLSRRLH